MKKLLIIIFILFLLAISAIHYLVIEPETIKEDLAYQKIIELRKQKVINEKRIYLLGKFEPSLREDFVAIPLKYAMAQNKMYLRKEAYDAFVSMHNHALKDNVVLLIASAARNFDYQKFLWEKKWNGTTLVDGKKLPESTPDELARFEKILEYSAAPGTSRHHWGTDIDINGADTKYFETKTGKKVYEWLTQNAHIYGFCQPYNIKDENRLSGYNEEKWHWSYSPLAKNLLKDYLELIKDEDITGFAGDTQVKNLYLIPNYVSSINPECR